MLLGCVYYPRILYSRRKFKEISISIVSSHFCSADALSLAPTIKLQTHSTSQRNMCLLSDY